MTVFADRHMASDVHILPDVSTFSKRAAQEFLQAATSAVAARDVFTVALTGGSTPKSVYALLASDPVFRSQLPWDNMRIYFGDERTVPPDHPDSNFHMANEVLLSRVPLQPEQIFRMKGEESDVDR